MIRHVRHGIYLAKRNRNIQILNCHINQNRGVGTPLPTPVRIPKRKPQFAFREVAAGTLSHHAPFGERLAQGLPLDSLRNNRCQVAPHFCLNRSMLTSPVLMACALDAELSGCHGPIFSLNWRSMTASLLATGVTIVSSE